jgi:hypothetical protein
MGAGNLFGLIPTDIAPALRDAIRDPVDGLRIIIGGTEIPALCRPASPLASVSAIIR